MNDACQRWREGTHSWRHRSEGGFDSSLYDVEALGDAEARAFVVGHHYSRSYPASVARYGLWEAGTLVGVAVLSIPVNAKALTGTFPGLEPMVESIELGRFVLLDGVPANGESYFLGQAFRLAAADGYRGVLSFSDPLPRRAAGGALIVPGHVGYIYQATNATYLGRGTARSLCLLPDGTVLNARSGQKVRAQERGAAGVEARLVALGAAPRARRQDPAAWLRCAKRQAGAVNIRHGGNHRYAFALGNRSQRRAVATAQLSHPYPKMVDPEVIPA